MSRSPSQPNHLLSPEKSSSDNDAPHSSPDSAPGTPAIMSKARRLTKATASARKPKSILKKGVAQVLKAQPKRPRYVTVVVPTTTASKRKREKRSPSLHSSGEDEALEDDPVSAAHKTDREIEAEEDAALDAAEKKIAERKRDAKAKAKKGEAKEESKKHVSKKARPQKKARKEGSEEEE